MASATATSSPDVLDRRFADLHAAGRRALVVYVTAGHPTLDRSLELLRGLTGIAWAPSGEGGTYSYYRRPGHHLGVHRDIDACDLAVITCVHESSRANDRAGALCLYPGRTRDALPGLRARPEDGALYVRLEPGQSLVLLGGIVPHRVVPVGERHARIVAPLCYRPA